MARPVDVLRRNRYFNESGADLPHSSLNHVDDWQEYHLPLARLHPAQLHDWGIASGLEVHVLPDSQQLEVQPGVAVDGQGRLIALADAGRAESSLRAPGEPNRLIAAPFRLSTAEQAGQLRYLTIQWVETLRRTQGVGGKLEQTPWLRLQPTVGEGAYVDDGGAIILAVVQVEATGVATAQAQQAGVRYGRRLLGSTTAEVGLRRATPRAGQGGQGPGVGDEASGWLRPLATGGLTVEVRDESDQVVLQQVDGLNFHALTVRADHLHVGGALAVTGDLTVSGTVNGRDVSADGQQLDSHVGNTSGNPHGTTAAQVGALALTGGTLSGNLTVAGNIGVSGTVDDRDVSADGQQLDSHVGNTSNPHRTTAAQVGALALTGGTLSGNLTVAGNIGVSGTVNGRDVSADGQQLDSHVGNTSNPHRTTAAQVGALALTGGTLSGNLTVAGNIGVSGTVDGRDVSADGQQLDSHVGNTSNPHRTTAAQVGALALTGGTLSGNLTVAGNIGVSGTVDGRDVSADGQQLDSHVGNTSNPHRTTAAQVGALALTGGTLTGNLEVAGVVKLRQGAAINEFSSDGKLADNSDAAVPTERAVKEYIDNLLVGCVAAFATTTPPPGWLECNGQAISRTQYARLFAQISTTFGSGNGSTTFNVPDLRGLVIRSWDHGRGLDSGRGFGSYQGDAFQDHQHSFSGTSASIGGGSHSHEALNAGFYQHVKLSGGGNAEVRQHGLGQTWPAAHAHAYTPSGSVSNATTGSRASETRIKNLALMYCVKS